MSSRHVDTSYTQQVKELVAQFHDNKKYAHTVVSDAREYFSNAAKYNAQKKDLTEDYQKAASDNAKALLKDKLKQLDLTSEGERLERVDRLNQFTDKFLSLTDADSESETRIASAKFLGTLLLITDAHKDDLPQQHQLLKPLYKAALALRLVDDVLAKGNIKHSYLGKYIDSLSRYTGNQFWLERWKQELAFPIVKAALMQDIGLYHPAAEDVLYGNSKDKDPFRLLDELERKMLLKLNLQHSLAYLKLGLGIPIIPANTKQEREKHNFIEQQALDFALETIQDATILKNHVGDIIKTPQIYSSFVLSTKSDYNRKDVPKGYMVIEQLMKNGTLEQRIATCFLKMVGYFPQGFGIAYIATDDQGTPKDGFEFAVVNRLYPDSPSEPRVRSVSRNRSFITSGKDLIIKKAQNLFFQSNHKKIQRIDKTRLKEIMSQLSGGQSNNAAEELIPQFWEPYDFFSEKKNQSIWTTRQ